MVISLALLGDAKAYPNDRTSWRLTPQRVGIIYFNTQRETQSPVKPAYDVRRESILVTEPATGRDVSFLGGEPSLLDSPEDASLVDTTAPQGDCGARGSTAELTPPPIGAEFSHEILAIFPDGIEFPFDDPEVYVN